MLLNKTKQSKKCVCVKNGPSWKAGKQAAWYDTMEFGKRRQKKCIARQKRSRKKEKELESVNEDCCRNAQPQQLQQIPIDLLLLDGENGKMGRRTKKTTELYFTFFPSFSSFFSL